MKTLTGKVVSAKMTKTVVVEVTSTIRHPLYHKRIKRSRKYFAHNEMDAKMGDKVVIAETRPMSRLKRWIITEITPSKKAPAIKE